MYEYFACVIVCVHYVCSVCGSQKILGSLELEWQVVMNVLVGGLNWWARSPSQEVHISWNVFAIASYSPIDFWKHIFSRHNRADTDVKLRDHDSMHKTCTVSRQKKVLAWKRVDRHRVLPLSKSYWSLIADGRGKDSFLYKMTLGISTTLHDRPHAQE